MVKNNVVSIAVESYSISKEQDGVRVAGLALPFNKTSRNNFTYIKESIVSAAPKMVKRPVLFNHNEAAVIGHVENVDVGPVGMTYVMNINPNAVNPETGVSYAESISRGDLCNVSIKCTYDEDKSFIGTEGVTNAYIEEFLELSVVTIPGFADTTAQVVESFKLKTKKENGEMIMETIQKEEAPVAAPVDPATPQPKEDPIAVVMARLEKCEADLKGLMDNYNKMMKEESEKPEDEPAPEPSKKDPTDDEDEKQKKVEEAIRKDKATVSTESFSQKNKVVTEKEIREFFMNI